MTSRKFENIIREAVEDCYDEFKEGNKLREMEAVLHRVIVQESIRRNNKAKLSARRIGVGYHRFRKILGKE